MKQWLVSYDSQVDGMNGVFGLDIQGWVGPSFQDLTLL